MSPASSTVTSAMPCLIIPMHARSESAITQNKSGLRSCAAKAVCNKIEFHRIRTCKIHIWMMECKNYLTHSHSVAFLQSVFRYYAQCHGGNGTLFQLLHSVSVLSWKRKSPTVVPQFICSARKWEKQQIKLYWDIEKMFAVGQALWKILEQCLETINLYNFHKLE